MKNGEKKPNWAVTKTVSLPPELLRAGMERSDQEQRTFSGYVRKLIADDVQEHLRQQRDAEHFASISR